MSSSRLALLAVVVLATLNACMDLVQIRATHRTAIARPPPLRRYSFIDEDYPPRMPLPSARRGVRLTLEDSVHYALWSPEAYDEWLFTATVGDGNVHYGPTRRLFVVSVTHQLHCMRSIREALERDVVPHGHQIPHLTHCLNFIRMSTLCAADITLEPPDAFARNHTRNRAGGEHVCMDWPAFYEDMRENSLEWDAFRNQRSDTMHMEHHW